MFISNNINSLREWFSFQVALEGLRISIPPGVSPRMAKLIKIAMNEEPGKRPRFDMLIPILEKMKAAS